MKLKWDFSEFTTFADHLQDLDNFERFAQQATKEIANALREALFQNTPVKTGNLAASWGGEENYSFTVKKLKEGYSVTLYNRATNGKFKYGLAVNDGHWSKNQYGGAYRWVEGRFFVESSIIQTAESNKLESIVMQELQNWWRSV